MNFIFCFFAIVHCVKASSYVQEKSNRVLSGTYRPPTPLVVCGTYVDVRDYDFIIKYNYYASICRVVKTTQCTSVPNYWKDKVTSVDVFDNCFVLFNTPRCNQKSQHIIVSPNTFHDLEAWGFIAQSAMPCVDFCTRHSVSLNLNHSASLYIYDQVNNDGNYTNLEVLGCTPIPSLFSGRVSSIVIGESDCIQLYENDNCSGQFIEATYQSPRLIDLHQWKSYKGAKSVSRCGLSCYQGNESHEGLVKISTDTGSFLNLNVGNCSNIPTKWENKIVDFKPNSDNTCYVLFETTNCSSDGRNVTIEKKNSTNSNRLNVTMSIRSIRMIPCSSIAQCTETPIEPVTQAYNVNNTNDKINEDENVTNSQESQAIQNRTITISLVSSLAVLVIIFSILFLLYWKVRGKKNRQGFRKKEISEFYKGNPGIFTSRGGNANYITSNMHYDPTYEFCKENVNIDKSVILGSHLYTTMFQGIAVIGGAYVKVCVKVVKPKACVRYIKCMLNDVKTMISVDREPADRHARILRLFGVVTSDLRENNLWILMELCSNGDLNTYLRDNRNDYVNLLSIKQGESSSKPQRNSANLSSLTLLKWSFQISDGMAYLSSKKIIHGNLRTNTILLDSDLNVKISHVSFSCQLYKYTQFLKGKQDGGPPSWPFLSLESLKNMKIYPETDIWAFGVTLWEIFTLGEKPYYPTHKTWSATFVDELENGLQLSMPVYATTGVYNVMMSCWNLIPCERPSFNDVRKTLRTLLETTEFNKENYRDIMETKL